MTWKIDPDPLKQSLADKLKSKQRELRESEDFPVEVEVKTHRALSWIKASEGASDIDSRFLYLWIAFNALYVEDHINVDKNLLERERFYKFFEKLISCDREKRIRDSIWKNFSNFFRKLIKNQYIYRPFWNHIHKGHNSDSWRKKFNDDNRKFLDSFERSDTVSVLADVFDRLYVLRNQIFHGGSTWRSEVNREQVNGCVDVLYLLVPMMVEIIIDNPQKNWGTLCYPNLENAEK